MKTPNVNNGINSKTSAAEAYASVADFGDALLSNMTRLYLLAYLLTGDHERAERCFVAGIDDCINRDSVFKEWAQSWARRAIIKNAIQIISPGLEVHKQIFDTNRRQAVRRSGIDNPVHNVVQLEPFERCVFVISVLERYSVQECSVLLKSTRGEVAKARQSAFEHLASVGAESDVSDAVMKSQIAQSRA